MRKRLFLKTLLDFNFGILARLAGRKVFRPSTGAVCLIAQGEVAWFDYPSVMQDLLSKHQIDLVLDVGANIGQFGKAIRALGYNGRLLSFEPIESTFLELSKLVVEDPSWDCFCVALGRSNAKCNIKQTESSDLSSFFLPNEFGKEVHGSRASLVKEIEVPVWNGVEFLRNQGIDLAKYNVMLKMDTQGYDLEVFAGFKEALSSIHILQSEISMIPIYEDSPHWTVNISQFEKMDYRVVSLFPVDSREDQLIEMDCIMTRKK